MCTNCLTRVCMYAVALLERTITDDFVANLCIPVELEIHAHLCTYRSTYIRATPRFVVRRSNNL